MLSAPASKRYLTHIPELDGVRGVAALAVFFHHLWFASFDLDGWGVGVQALASLSKFGYAGVDLFFVLSGFLITSLLIEDRANPRYYQDFYWKRALRILPLYAICLLVMYLTLPHSGLTVVLATLFLANFSRLFHIPLYGPFWTLAIEEQFYLLWPTIVRRRTIEAVTRFALWIWASAIVLRLVAACFGKHDYIFTFLHSDGLAIGAWLACQFERRNRLGIETPVRPIVYLAPLASAGFLILISFRMTGGPVPVAFGAAFLQTGVSLITGLLLAYILVNRGARSLAFFRSRVLIFFGSISYAFYMFHLFVLDAYDRLRGPMQPGDMLAYGMRTVIILGVTVALCILSRLLIEKPASSLRKYVLKPHPAPSH